MKARTIVLWCLQIVLATLFLFSGTAKLVMSAAVLTKGSPFSATFLRFIGVCEIVGAVGLVVPSLTRIKPMLTPIAAGCLAVIMIGATVTTAQTMGMKVAALPFVCLILVVFVAIGRSSLAPIAARHSAG
jgi:uncharacterized membrane protein YphA (DoxX/SURF4 family)